MTFLRPTPIAVHNHRDVPREPFKVQALEQARLFRRHCSERARSGYLQRFGSLVVRHDVFAGFPVNPLYAAKLTYVSAAAQLRGAVSIIMVAAARFAERAPYR